MSRFADGIDKYVEIGNRVMPFGYHNNSLPDQRQMFANYADELPFDRDPNVTSVDIEVNKVKCRKYTTRSSTEADAVVYFHGGGFVLGGADSHDDLAHAICAETRLTVYLVEYRLAPEHKYPAALDDAVAVVEALAQGGASLTIAGESSGGNVAAYVCRVLYRGSLRSRIKKAALFCPVLNFARWAGGGDDAPRLSGDEMNHFVTCYTGSAVRPDAIEVSPLLHDGAFQDFPPSYIAYASEDSLSADALELSKQLDKAGVTHQLIRHQGLVHACLRAKPLSPEADRSFRLFCQGMQHV